MGSAPNVPASIYQRRLHLPSADEIDDAELAQAIAEVQRLRDKAEKAKDDAGAAHFELEAAEQRDHQALADHARKGGRKPSPTAEAVRAKKAKLEAGASVLATA